MSKGLKMKVLVSNNLVGGVECPSCNHWEGVAYSASVVDWTRVIPRCSSMLRCDRCGHIWQTGQWDLVHEPEKLPFE